MKRIFIAAILILTLATAVYAKNTPVSISGWAQSFWQAPDNTADLDLTKTGVKITTDKTKVANGLASIEIFCEKNYDNLNAQAAQSISTLETGKTYRMTGKFNVHGSVNSWRYRLMFGTVQLAQLSNIISGMDVWCDAEYTFLYNFASTEFRIQACGGGTILADDLSMREVKFAEDGKTVIGYGDELMVNGDFESNLDLTPPGEVTNVQVENMDGQAQITWKNPSDSDFVNAAVYDVTAGEKVLAGTSVTGQILLTGLTNNTVYTMLIQTTDGWGNASQGVTVFVQPVPAPFKYTEPVFYLNGVLTSSLSAGTLKAVVNFKNNAMPEDYSAELILVLLKDGALVDIGSAYAIIPRTDEKGAYTEAACSLEVPEGEGYTVVLHIWDSMTGMETIADNISIQ